MKPYPRKPNDYSPISPDEFEKIGLLHEDFIRRDAIATQIAHSEVYEIQQKRYKRVSIRTELEIQSRQRMWENYDLYSRAILYLTVRNGGGFDRSTLLTAKNGTHGFTSDEIETYIAEYPESLFACHCDIGMRTGEKYKLEIPKSDVKVIQTVIPEFAYYINNRMHNHRWLDYFTLWDGQLKLLPTSDYDHDLEYDWDGRCNYIQ